jgi:hypothetical protein
VVEERSDEYHRLEIHDEFDAEGRRSLLAPPAGVLISRTSIPVMVVASLLDHRLQAPMPSASRATTQQEQNQQYWDRNADQPEEDPTEFAGLPVPALCAVSKREGCFHG